MIEEESCSGRIPNRADLESLVSEREREELSRVISTDN